MLHPVRGPHNDDTSTVPGHPGTVPVHRKAVAARPALSRGDAEPPSPPSRVTRPVRLS